MSLVSSFFNVLFAFLRLLINALLYPFYLRLPERSSHTAAVPIHDIQAQIKQRPAGSTLKIKRSNVSHVLPRASTNRLHKVHVGSQDRIITIDSAAATVSLEPSVTMEQLVDALLPLDLLPFVVPEFKNLTVGGLIAGAGLESSSFKHGQFADTLASCRYLLADGSILECSPEQNAGFFYGAMGAMGTLGLLVECTLKLERLQGKRWVQVQQHQLTNPVGMLRVLLDKKHESIDYLDAVYFSPIKSVVTLASRIDRPGKITVDLSSRWSQFWYLHLSDSPDQHVDYMSLKDYIFRFDKCAFWMGRYAFPNALNYPPIRALVSPILSTGALYSRLHAAPQPIVQSTLLIQDIYIPLEKADEFLALVPSYVSPIWLCPIKRTTSPQLFSPHHASSESEWLVNFGIYWGQTRQRIDVKQVTRDLEAAAMRMGGRKMLYADTYYTQEQWDGMYDVKAYEELKRRYDPERAWGDVRTKVVS